MVPIRLNGGVEFHRGCSKDLSACAVGKCTVFNIHGNRFRLIARINYEWRKVYILGIYTHKEYDEGKWKHGCESN